MVVEAFEERLLETLPELFDLALVAVGCYWRSCLLLVVLFIELGGPIGAGGGCR